MAIYHCHVDIIRRSKGQSVVAAAAYRAGEKLKDQRLDRTANYLKKQVDETMILAPSSVPSFMLNRELLWNEVEKKETRKDSQLARSVDVALPVELSNEEQSQLIRNYVQENFVDKGMVADIAIHRDNPENPHAHVLLTMREIKDNGFGNKVTDWNNRGLVEQWRENWATMTNHFLERAGSEARIDHRSHKERNIHQIPTIHLGPKVIEMEKRGVQTRKLNEFIEIRKANRELKAIQKEIHQVQEEIATSTTLSDVTEAQISLEKEKVIPKPSEDTKNQNKPISDDLKQEVISIVHTYREVDSNLQDAMNNLESLKKKEQTLKEAINKPNQLEKEKLKYIKENMELKPSNFVEHVLYLISKERQNKVKNNALKLQLLQDDQNYWIKQKPKHMKELEKVKRDIKETEIDVSEKRKIRDSVKQEKDRILTKSKSKSKTKKKSLDR